jgi:hypothetical protein
MFVPWLDFVCESAFDVGISNMLRRVSILRHELREELEKLGHLSLRV